MPPQPTPYFTTVLNPSTTPNNNNTSTFTPAQRSLQSRNKPFNPPHLAALQADSFDARQRKNQAVEILESTELLLWFSAYRNESVSATRQHYTNILLGLENAVEPEWREEWEVPVEERVKPPDTGSKSVEGSPRHGKHRDKKKGEEGGKGKKRVASGTGSA